MILKSWATRTTLTLPPRLPYSAAAMKYWLVIFVLSDGAWVAGAEMSNPGWSPRAYESLEVCTTRREFAAKLVKQIGKTQAKHFCTQTPGASLAELEKAEAQ